MPGISRTRTFLARLLRRAQDKSLPYVPLCNINVHARPIAIVEQLPANSSDRRTTGTLDPSNHQSS